MEKIKISPRAHERARRGGLVIADRIDPEKQKPFRASTVFGAFVTLGLFLGTTPFALKALFASPEEVVVTARNNTIRTCSDVYKNPQSDIRTDIVIAAAEGNVGRLEEIESRCVGAQSSQDRQEALEDLLAQF